MTHQPTEKYLDMLYANNFIPLITKPTRITDHSKTLIDHIYTNMPLSEVLSGIAVCDISDHLPVFCVMNVPCQKINIINKRHYRDYKQFNKEAYLHDLMQIDWNVKLNDLTNNINRTTMHLLKKSHVVKLKQFTKPWITDGILKSIKNKQKMCRTHFFSNNSRKIEQYKDYSNNLNKI